MLPRDSREIPFSTASTHCRHRTPVEKCGSTFSMHGRSGGAAMNPGDSCPSKLEDGWLVGRPAGHGFDPAIFQDMQRRVVEGKLDNVHAIIVARDGVLVYEQYAAGQDQNGVEPATHTVFNAATRHNGNSMTKS